MKHITLWVCFCFCCWLLSCCTYHPDARLEHISLLADSGVQEARTLWDSIPRAELSDADQHYYDLLDLKVHDEPGSYTSDSLILEVVDYYAHHRGSGLYAEALYYGGRVYQQLGDLPTALSYMRHAMDELPEGANYVRRRRNILSQTADLYRRLYMYDDALHYYEQALAYDSLLADNRCLMEDYELLGYLRLNQVEVEGTMPYFQRAVRAAAQVSEQDSIRMTVHVAGVLAEAGQSDSALAMLRGLYAKTEGMSRNMATVFLALAYYGKEQWDSVCVYAQKLIDDPDYDNRKSGYTLLLQPDIRGLLPPDTLAEYSLRHNLEVMECLRQHDSQEALMQNTMYNYRKHERERDAALTAEHRVVGALVGTMLVVLALVIVLLYMKNRNAQQVIKLRQALDVIDRLQAAPLGRPHEAPRRPSAPAPLTVEALRQQIAERLQDEAPRYEVPAALRQTDAYQQLAQSLALGKGIPDRDALWPALATAVEASFPGFRQRLQLLTDDNLTDADLQIVLLLKCGVSPSGMAVLLNKTKGAISSRRRTLSLKIFGENMGNAVIDSVMQQL